MRSNSSIDKARRFLERTIALHGEPNNTTIDKSGRNTALTDSYNTGYDTAIELR